MPRANRAEHRERECTSFFAELPRRLRKRKGEKKVRGRGLEMVGFDCRAAMESARHEVGCIDGRGWSFVADLPLYADGIENFRC